jgi:hypothetical protein
MRKEQIEKAIVEIERALEMSSGYMFGLDQLLENDFENERYQYEYKKANETHNHLYNALIQLKNAMKGIK